ncbi:MULTISPECIES: EAL domain-containing protein [Agrobacterium]|uniref:cyclic-guanylate-specific phosphodiesterase n=1 Tax=Agrobacterium tumefaciens TaxID=358 RepID=A0AAE6BFD7_AGRTU|nr:MULTISPECIES: EAL domain-containing protein [Agrobacterium]QCL76289.1 EAL domain-containing protein [Agrobacterium tumefaciens]QCL81806.1 EAL domain-containing protein [Agrobacterium tumefaciens]CUX68134.1 putative transmembrane EAL domain protein [Agrobacterium sp. NCPPB 925]
MRARRWRVIAVGIVLALLGAALPIAAMAWTSWRVAVQKELDILDLVAQRALARAGNTFKEAQGALEAIEAAHLPACSDQHIAQMRIVTINVPSIEEIGYFENDVIKCTSWGGTTGTISKSHVDYVTPEGIEVTLRIEPAVSHGDRMTSLHLGHHNALVAPSRFVDIMLRDGMALALLNDQEQVISTQNQPDADIVVALAAQASRGINDASLYSVVKDGGLTAVVLEPRAAIREKLARELIVLLPIGVFIASFIVGIIVWMSRKRLSPQAELEIAVRKREFVVHYQPIIDLKTHICVGAEALVRWRRPDGTLVRPDLFIPLAEETGLIEPITDQVVEAIIADIGSILVADRTLHIAVNLCAEDVKTGRILEFIDQRLKPAGIRKQQIWLEATERGFIDIDAARITLDRARKAGHSVAIDDFGTGYSSLQYLQGLPLDALKIDKSFVDTIGRNTATSTVTLHIIGMARELGLFSVAEGIETEEQAAYLREHGVDFGQGWLFSRPLPAEKFIVFQRHNKSAYGAAPEVIQATPVEKAEKSPSL